MWDVEELMFLIRINFITNIGIKYSHEGWKWYSAIANLEVEAEQNIGSNTSLKAQDRQITSCMSTKLSSENSKIIFVY